MSARSYIIDDHEKKTFLLDREVLVSEDILRSEMTQIFGHCWIYVGHASELKKPGDFRSRKVAGRPVIFCRDQGGAFHCLFNTCRHRGAIVCTEREGNRRRFQCIYHGWTYGNDGRLVGVPGDDAYAEGFDKSSHGLRRPARFEDYRGFWFMCLDGRVPPLADYLAGAKEYIDLVLDQSPSGRMEIIAGVQEYDVAANWKLMVENSVDDYHLPSTHSTWLNFMANSGVKIEPPKEEGLVLPTKGFAVELGNGHFTTDNINFRGRPVAKWIPLYGEAAKAEIDEIRRELVARLGAEPARAGWPIPTATSGSFPTW
jgi:p-cumate 2,3-dioxygenase alpha subunit